MQLNAWCTICDQAIINCTCHRKIANIIKYRLEIGNDPNFVNHPGAAAIKIQPKPPKFLLDMRYFCNFSLVSLGIRPRSRLCGTDTAGRGALEPPPEGGVRTKPFDREFQYRESHTSAEIKKNLLSKYLNPKKDFIFMYMPPQKSKQ